MGRLNKSGKVYNKESYTYYNKMYNANKSYYKKKGYLNAIPLKLNKAEWDMAKQSGKSNKSIIYDEFHKYTKQQAKIIQGNLRRRGTNLSIFDIARGDIPDDVYDHSRNYYNELRAKGWTSGEAGKEVSHSFWGSP